MRADVPELDRDNHEGEAGVTLVSPQVIAPRLPPLGNSVAAQLYLAQWHLDRGAMSEAFCLFSQAARSEHPTCLNMLGRVFEQGWGTKRDVQEARRLFERAASGGEGWAFYNLADLYLNGDGVVQDRVRACTLYMEAARRGVGKAFNMLGLIHEDGYGACPANVHHARDYYIAGRDCGDAAAAVNLARLGALDGS
ncbi:tetratricopeptide repeat protein [Asaia sp. As-1742]|uniref:tetratricopeptide repeat protein n=1 Tax=Asaia sp. As-1742 TaxID=2608325 RepID=UPI001422932F|nr:tetratricopeptide repeat protein [Asaia sp. As-1742]NIE78648.1 sel1 repeat family protein [Asaia sp. As-1742]